MNSSSEENVLNEENLYVVEKILKRQYKRRNGRREPHYYIRWQGFPKQEDHTWEPLSNLTSVNFMVEEFQAKWIEKKKKEGLIQSDDKVRIDSNQLKLGVQNFISKHKETQHQEEDKIRKKFKLDQSQKQKTKIPQSRHLQPAKLDMLKEPIILKYPSMEKNPDNNCKDQKGQKQHKQLKQQKGQKQQKIVNQMEQKAIYGRIVNHLCQNGKMIYEVQRLNNEKKVLKIISMGSDKARIQCQKSGFEYLQSFVIDLQTLHKPQ